jgi:hypothetical protein
MRFPVIRLVAAWSITHFGYRAAVIALPLLALAETGSAWTVGLVAGAAGLPTITAPWWSRTLQRRLATARALAALLALEGLATLAVPVAAVLGLLTPATMIASGLAVGVLNAVSAPLDSALLAALGDRRDAEYGAAQVLALQETSVRLVMMLAPMATLPLIAMVGSAATVALEGVLSIVGASLIVSLVVRAHPVEEDEPPRVHGWLRSHPEIRSGWTVRGVGCAAWFAFTLGLALLGQETGRGVLLATIGLTAYSVGGGRRIRGWRADSSVGVPGCAQQRRLARRGTGLGRDGTASDRRRDRCAVDGDGADRAGWQRRHDRHGHAGHVGARTPERVDGPSHGGHRVEHDGQPGRWPADRLGRCAGGHHRGWVVVLVVSSIVLVSSVAAPVRRTTGTPAEPTSDRSQSIRV